MQSNLISRDNSKKGRNGCAAPLVAVEGENPTRRESLIVLVGPLISVCTAFYGETGVNRAPYFSG